MPWTARMVKRAAVAGPPPSGEFPAPLLRTAPFVSNWPRSLGVRHGEAGLSVRLTFTLAMAGALLAACAGGPGRAPSVTAGSEAVGHLVEEIAAANGPPSRQWDLPDGRRVYQWQSSSVTARVGAAGDGALLGAASQTTCFYTFYAKPGPKGFVVVGAEPQRPGCLKLAMNGVAK
jgi:hypothetical protein